MLNASTFRKYNLIAGWAVFLFAAIIYCVTIEPTASFWDCGEYIACSYGLEAGHPPGAPFFLLVAKFFSLFSVGSNEHVAACINTMSALASAFTVLFLFWSITHLAKKVMLKTEEDFSKIKAYVVLAAGIVGALSYAFTDSAWFSAEEGEVYALSSLFTAIVFWAMLKWENVADEPHSDRWLVFIAYMIGLSIGVHLLNLLTIPALVFIFYFRKREKLTWHGVLITSIIAVVMLGGVQDILIPGIVNLAGKTELYFVNSRGFGFNSGIIFYFSLLLILIVAGIYFTTRKKIRVLQAGFAGIGLLVMGYVIYQLFFLDAPLSSIMNPLFIILIAGVGVYLANKNRVRWLNVAILSFAVLLIGYSSFFVLVIRAQAGTPINENNPSNPISLLSYLNREQYGDWPLLYGQNYNTPLNSEEPYKDGNPVYVRDDKSKKYIISDARKQTEANYDDRGCTVFPRMYSSGFGQAYTSWVHVRGDSTVFTDKFGRVTATANIPTLGENLQFFITYQCGWMYTRYFFWNFIGRQNDHLGYGNDVEGNVLTGIAPLDDARLGDQDLIPDIQRTNKARNRYFAIPFLLGIFGLIWQFNHAKRDAVVALLLFLFTGLAIVFYLNQTPWQPRERDYAYVGSFYAFSIWIGLGVIGLFHFFGGTKRIALAVTVAFSFSILSPTLLLAQNWDDHDRSGRTVANDIAVNYLKSCERNAIIFTYADNDTFPLWYAQEVLGIRKDVRIICLSLFRSDWYIDQAKKQQYTSEPLPITLSHWQYREGTLDYLNIFEDSKDTLDLRRIVKTFTSNDPADKFLATSGDTLNYIPTRSLMLPVNKDNFLAQGGMDGYQKNEIEDTIAWRLRGNYILKDQIAMLDIIAHNNWKRPVYFAVNMPVSSYAGLDNYLQLEGLAYRLVPFSNKREEKSLQARPQVNLEKSYKLAMDTFSYGGLKDPDVYADETSQRMFVDPMRFSCSVLANALAESGKTKEAINVIKKCTSEIPATQMAPDNYWLDLINAAYIAGDKSLAEKLSRDAFDFYFGTIRWYNSFEEMRRPGDYNEKCNGMFAVIEMAENYNDIKLAKEFKTKMREVGLRMPVAPPEPEPEPMDTSMDSILMRDSGN